MRAASATSCQKGEDPLKEKNRVQDEGRDPKKRMKKTRVLFQCFDELLRAPGLELRLQFLCDVVGKIAVDPLAVAVPPIRMGPECPVVLFCLCRKSLSCRLGH